MSGLNWDVDPESAEFPTLNYTFAPPRSITERAVDLSLQLSKSLIEIIELITDYENRLKNCDRVRTCCLRDVDVNHSCSPVGDHVCTSEPTGEHPAGDRDE